MSQPIPIIVNPTAGGGRARHRWQRLEVQLRQCEVRYHCLMTGYPHHATQLAAEAVRSGAPVVGVVGGDGTLHEVIQALAGSQTAVAFLAGGSSCDFNKDLPHHRAWHTRLIEPAIIERDLIRIECQSLERVGVCRYCVNGSHIGLVAEAARKLNTSSLRGWSVDLAAITAAVRAWGHFSPPDMHLLHNVHATQARLLNVAVLKTTWLCGLMHLGVPVAGDDGRMVVLTVSPANLVGLIAALYRRKLLEHPAIKWRSCEKFGVCQPAGLAVEADGEIIGMTPATFSIAPCALRVAV